MHTHKQHTCITIIQALNTKYVDYKAKSMHIDMIEVITDVKHLIYQRHRLFATLIGKKGSKWDQRTR